MTLGKHVLILLEECHECLANCWFGKSANPRGSIYFGAIEGYLLEPLYGFCPCLLFLYAHGL